MHYVCTRDEARDLIKSRDTFWISNCGCREQRGGCARSRVDVCVDFYEQSSSGGLHMRQASRDDIEGIFDDAKEKHLVTRPFRDLKDPSKVDGICFCCDDCCGYFLDPGEECDKGDFIEETDIEKCNDCGLCADVCYFNARVMNNGKLTVNRELCYGCGLCVDVCPETCITMVKRENVNGVKSQHSTYEDKLRKS